MNQTIENVKAITVQIGKALSENIGKDNPDEVMGKMGELNSLLATSSHAVALSDMLYNQKIFELMETAKYGSLNATEKKMIFAGLAKEEIYYMTLCERQNRALVHAIDSWRSILSFIKSEMGNAAIR